MSAVPEPAIEAFLATPEGQILRPSAKVVDALEARGFSRDYITTKMSIPEMKQALARPVPAVPEVTEVSTRLATLDLPNVKVTGSYAIGKATPESDIDLLVGIPDAEWGGVSLYDLPEAIQGLYDVLPETKLSIHLYKLSKPNELWHFQRPRVEEGRHISGAFVPVDYSQEVVKGMWGKAIEPKTAVTPAVEEGDLECMICHKRFDHLTLGTCETCYKKWTGGK